MIQPRRGFDDYGCTKAPCCLSYTQIFGYKERILVHSVQPCNKSQLFFDSTCQDGAFKPFSGFYEPLDTGLRIKFVESNANLYFTTSDGIKKISGTLECGVTNFIGGIYQATSTCNVDFVACASCVSTATRVAGSFITCGFVAGSSVTIKCASNTANNLTFTPITVTALTITTCGCTFTNSCNDGVALFEQRFITDAGGPKALDVSGTLAFTCGGFMPCRSRTAYRILWGTKDANKVLILGAPSSRLVITNTDECACVSANVCVTFTIPSDVDTPCFFYQIFRSRVVCTCNSCCIVCLAPGDEMNQVFEASITAANLTAGTITVQDTLCCCFRESGVLLYTNSVSGEGILQSNDKPPVAKDVELFRETVFFSNTKTIQRKQFNILGVCCFKTSFGPLGTGLAFTACPTNTVVRDAGSWITDGFAVGQTVNVTKSEGCGANDGERIITALVALTMTLCCVDTTNADDTTAVVSTTSKFVIGNSTTDREYRFIGEKEVYTITTVACCSNSLDGDYILVNSASDEKKYLFWFNTSGGCATEPTGVDTDGRIAVAVAITSCATACAVATALDSSMCGKVDFCTSVTTNVVTVTNDKNGNTTDTANGSVSPGFTFSVTTQGDGECSSLNDVLLSSQLLADSSIDETARSLVSIINRDCCGIANAFYLSGEDDLPGIILLESRNLSDSEFYIGVCNCKTTARYNPGMPCAKYITGTAGACSCACTVVTTATNHGFIVNDDVFIYNVCCSALACKFTISSKTDTTFTVCANFSCTTTGRVFKADEVSDNCVKPNRLFFSKTGIPEAVPLGNFLDVGRQDSAIQRILALRDNLFVMKDDGVFILTGNCGCFTVRLLGSSTNIVAPDSAVVLNNQIFMLSTQGVTSVSDTGIGVVSRAIEDKILDITGDCFCTSTASYGVAYESDRSYLLWVPTVKADTVSTQVFRYNTFNKSWVRWTVQGRAGIVNPVDDKLYISAGCNSFIKQERKTNDRTDFADRQFCICIPCQATISGTALLLSDVTCIAAGDVLVQTQRITLAKFNRLLRQLDSDPLLTCTNYASTIKIGIADCLGAALVALEIKLCADDPCKAYTAPSAAPSTFAIIRTDFNTLTTELNCSAGTAFSDYDCIGACCTTDYEVIVTSVNTTTTTVCLGFNMPVIVGPIVVYKGIGSVIEWAPQHFGDPSIVKQIPESTVVFDGNNFFKSKIGYSTDLSKDFSCFEFNGRGPGFWGGFVWNCSSWGGCGTDVPYRTLIPRAKQRCRYITAKFKHDIAREDFKILGISFEVRPLSTRGYRSL